MDRYDGPGNISGGGSYIRDNGVGAEIYNFKPSRGTCYGYAMSGHSAGIDLRNLAPDQRWERGDALHGVDVVFMAKHKDHGQVVVGWYRNATVFHKQYLKRRGTIPGMHFEQRHYLCSTDAANATLLTEEQRTFVIPYAPKDGAGYAGQSNVWYPERSSNPQVPALIKKLRTLIEAGDGVELAPDEHQERTVSKNGRKRGKPDAARNALVEAAAVDAVSEHYEFLNYVVKRVEKENLGWDLEVSHGAKKHKIEVKGVSADTIYFELTPNEYRMLREHPETYQVSVVCSALDIPVLYHLLPKSTEEGWRLIDKMNGIDILLGERVAAIGRDVAVRSDAA
ncbi:MULTISPECIES: protein NO VEIN domain-containing protein [Xanthomonas]|uniref:protein NO VEIN domain-containing protein n=1 Tax=Xanthomonas TaxID=338 RepID=UPI0003B03F36|nr:MULTISPECIES: DUF3883 domain-containing protein [Xanthomonas]ATS62659.2 DUF3883 domain-containing protein [Xanthomonas citri pv. phaseoli var. fuscans]ATS72301.2 DUF3883 domain-containing protein [Xanthomonas citri pv. phaseoli var. fuscans]ATS75076.2 DUF3883 domain-containing protein [Xanthomonas citri pv. phaseoli var. fuscans]ATS81257.2 DUF3883 domain-containing protein [Xanthomonas citri pv. phaseoli var. fuscans]CDF62675.1 hypothetical protein XFF4834R_chr32300 [Xanthomonas citri pv. f